MAENSDWRSTLPPEYQTVDSLSKFKDLGGLVKSYIDMERFLSTTGRVPKDGDKQETWDSYHKHWGRPEKHDGYVIPNLPQEYQLDDKFKTSLTQMAHTLGLNQKQFDRMILWGLDTSKGIFEEQGKVKNTALDNLKKEWGWQFDLKRDRAHKTIAMLVDYKKDHPFVKWLETSGLDDDPVVLQFFSELSNRLGEDNFVDEQTKKEISDKEQADKKIREILADLKGPYYNELDPRHKDTVQEMARLHEVVYNE